jgi:hypothetical protein
VVAKLIISVLALSSAIGCSIVAPNCPDDLLLRVDPTEATISVGESITATGEFRGCGGRQHLDDDILWSSADSSIARVDAATGRITGRTPGATVVQARGARYGSLPPIAITVR